jgi:hypothetical protein
MSLEYPFSIKIGPKGEGQAIQEGEETEGKKQDFLKNTFFTTGDEMV